MSNDASTTTDHQTIQRWIEKRGGKPAIVGGTGNGGDGGVLKVRFEEDSQDDLVDVAWDEFFRTFDNNRLAFLHEEQTADGAASRFCKFVER